MKKLLFLIVLSILSLNTFASSKAPSLSEEQKMRILAKVVAAVEEEIGAECPELRYGLSVEVAYMPVSTNKVSKCGGVKIKQKLNGFEDKTRKVVIDF